MRAFWMLTGSRKQMTFHMVVARNIAHALSHRRGLGSHCADPSSVYKGKTSSFCVTRPVTASIVTWYMIFSRGSVPFLPSAADPRCEAEMVSCPMLG